MILTNEKLPFRESTAYRLHQGNNATVLCTVFHPLLLLDFFELRGKEIMQRNLEGSDSIENHIKCCGKTVDSLDNYYIFIFFAFPCICSSLDLSEELRGGEVAYIETRECY